MSKVININVISHSILTAGGAGGEGGKKRIKVNLRSRKKGKEYNTFLFGYKVEESHKMRTSLLTF